MKPNPLADRLMARLATLEAAEQETVKQLSLIQTVMAELRAVLNPPPPAPEPVPATDAAPPV